MHLNQCTLLVFLQNKYSTIYTPVLLALWTIGYSIQLRREMFTYMYKSFCFLLVSLSLWAPTLSEQKHAFKENEEVLNVTLLNINKGQQVHMNTCGHAEKKKMLEA